MNKNIIDAIYATVGNRLLRFYDSKYPKPFNKGDMVIAKYDSGYYGITGICLIETFSEKNDPNGPKLRGDMSFKVLDCFLQLDDSFYRTLGEVVDVYDFISNIGEDNINYYVNLLYNYVLKYHLKYVNRLITIDWKYHNIQTERNNENGYWEERWGGLSAYSFCLDGTSKAEVIKNIGKLGI